MPIFSIIGVNDNGTIVAQLNKALKDYFLNLNSGEFTLLCLPEFRQLTSIYSQILYRYLLSWRANGVVVVQIDELYDVLGVPPSIKKDFRNFRLRVLVPAQKEITDKTSLFFTWEGKTEGSRKITAIEFNFREKKHDLSVTAQMIEQQKESTACWMKHRDSGVKCKPDLRTNLCEYCVTRGPMLGRV